MTDEEFIRKHIELEKSLCEAVKKAKANAKSEILKALEDVKAEIEDIDGITEIGAQILDEVSGIINRKIAEVTKNEKV